VESGRRFLFSSGTDQLDSVAAPQLQRLDFLSEYRDRDVPLVTAARMSATFPYVSPIARVDIEIDRPHPHLADGAYFDNSGVFSAVEWIRWQLQRPESVLRQQRLRRVLLVRLSMHGGESSHTGTRVGWRNAIWGPLLTMMNVRGASQVEHAEQTLQLFEAWCRTHYGIVFEHANIEYQGAGPLSWQLGAAEVAELERRWQDDFEAAIDRVAAGQPLDPTNPHHAAIAKLASNFEIVK
jgi:hypothetical protein